MRQNWARDRLAISSTFEGAVATAGLLIGGLLAAATGYAIVFWIAIVFECAALAMLALGVSEPRRRDRAGVVAGRSGDG